MGKQIDGFGYGPQNTITGGEDLQIVHNVTALTAFFISWFETVMIWFPNRILHGVYAAVVVGFIMTQTQNDFEVGDGNTSNNYYEVIPQWTAILLNLIVAWANCPRVQREIEEGKWKPWLGCCHCCCPSVEVLDGNCCCPPGPCNCEV